MPRLTRSERLGLVRAYGHAAVSRAALEEGLGHFTIKGIEGFIPYRVQSGILLAPGEPVCAEGDARRFFEGFRDMAAKKRKGVCFFGANDRLHDQARAAGYDLLKFGEEAVLDVKAFSLKGNRMLNVRRGVNRCENAGVRIFEYLPKKKRDRGLERDMERVSAEWLSTKPTPELGFLMGRPELGRLEGRRVFTATLDGEVRGFMVLNPLQAENSWYADILRRSSEAPNGVMESLTVHALGVLKKENTHRLYYGMVPFVGIDPEAPEHRRWNKLMHGLQDRMGFLYPIKNEYFFKNKFKPAWKPVYMLAYPKISTRMIFSIISAFIPGGVSGLLKYKLKKR